MAQLTLFASCLLLEVSTGYCRSHLPLLPSWSSEAPQALELPAEFCFERNCCLYNSGSADHSGPPIFISSSASEQTLPGPSHTTPASRHFFLIHLCHRLGMRLEFPGRPRACPFSRLQPVLGSDHTSQSFTRRTDAATVLLLTPGRPSWPSLFLPFLCHSSIGPLIIIKSVSVGCSGGIKIYSITRITSFYFHSLLTTQWVS